MRIILRVRYCSVGVESQDWASMLRDMYEKYALKHDYKVGRFDDCLLISGNIPENWLLSERGIHRLVRISPHDPQKRRHTSFAEVIVDLADGSEYMEPVRSYILHPYTLVKDHLRGVETKDAKKVLSGDLDLIINPCCDNSNMVGAGERELKASAPHNSAPQDGE